MRRILQYDSDNAAEASGTNLLQVAIDRRHAVSRRQVAMDLAVAIGKMNMGDAAG